MAKHEIASDVKAERRLRAIRMLEAACRDGARCPTNDVIGYQVLPDLAREGMVKIEVYAHNWRTITMMSGPLKGKRSAECPMSTTPYRTIYKDHVVMNQRQHRRNRAITLAGVR